MKARKLKQRLATDMIVSNHPGCIAVGNHCCLKMICVDKKSLKLSYAFDLSGKGRDCLFNDPPKLRIWDTLAEMILTGEIDDYLTGQDDIAMKDRVWVYTVHDGELIQTYTDALGFPNTTVHGNVMFPGQYFSTEREAIMHYVKQYHENVDFHLQLLEAKQQEVQKIKFDIRESYDMITYLQSLMKDGEQKNPA